jgi:hypothetical protein
MKTILTSIGLLLAITAQGGERGVYIPDELRRIQGEERIVPTGKTYLVYDGKGKKVAQFRSGQRTNMSTDCVLIKCPSTFNPDVVCWKCMGFTANQQSNAPIWSQNAGSLSNRPMLSYAEVPVGKTYVVYDAKRKKVGEFRSGQRTPKATDCAMIKCPSTFGKDVVCWQCMGFAAK